MFTRLLSSRGKAVGTALVLSTGGIWAASNSSVGYTAKADSPTPPQESFIEKMSSMSSRARKWFSWESISGGLSDPALESFLPDSTPDSFGREPRTLVIAFEGTLVNTDWSREQGWIIRKRPGVDKFLSRLFNLGYEIVVFSSNYEGITTPVINNFDKHQVFSYRIFRECLLFKEGKYVKDLDRLNRDLSKVLVIDHNPEAFSKHPDNGIVVNAWDGDSGDVELLKLLPFLESLVKEDVRDVRELIRGYGSENIADKYREHMNEVQKMIAEEQNQVSRRGGSWFGSALSGKKTKRNLPKHH